MPFVDYPGFAGSDADAQARFKIAKKDDPFQEIEPSLLNSADIQDYVRMTGMLYPFHIKQLKSASYEAAIWGQCICWDQEGKRKEVRLENQGDQFTLEANSIAFVQVEPLFRLPDYIALRFNLKIKHVHRGILLGTGPLVDPGFEGRLLIPLHNLTLNPYTFSDGEGLIWIEFTKTSCLPVAGRGGKNDAGLSRLGEYHEFDPDKKNIPAAEYFRKADPHRPIRSSIPDVLRESRDAAKEAEARVETAASYVRNLSIGGAIAILLTVAGLGYGTWSLLHESWKAVTDVQEHLRQELGMEQDRARKMDELQTRIESLDKRLMDEMTTLQERLDKVSARVGRLHGRQSSVKQQEPSGSQPVQPPVR